MLLSFSCSIFFPSSVFSHILLFLSSDSCSCSYTAFLAPSPPPARGILPGPSFVLLHRFATRLQPRPHVFFIVLFASMRHRCIDRLLIQSTALSCPRPSSSSRQGAEHCPSFSRFRSVFSHCVRAVRLHSRQTCPAFSFSCRELFREWISNSIP